MTSKKIILLLLISIGTNCFSQDKPLTDITDITKVTFLSPGIGYEKRIAKYQSLYIQAFMSISAGLAYSDTFGFTSGFDFDPALSIEYRYYYNFVKRRDKGRRVDMNSLNYLSPFFRTVFPKRNIPSSPGYFERRRRAVHSIGGTWGMQRNYKGRFSLDLNIGVGYFFKEASYTDESGQVVKDNTGQIDIPGRLSLGIWLNKRK